MPENSELKIAELARWGDWTFESFRYQVADFNLQFVPDHSGGMPNESGNGEAALAAGAG